MALRTVVLVASDQMQTIGIAGPIEIFDAATQVLGGRGGYDVRIASLDGRPVRASGGMRIAADTTLGQVRSRGVDTLLVGGGIASPRGSADPRLPAAIERIAHGARRTTSVCAGAFHLAEAGLLDGRMATTHWAFCDELARRYPAVTVAPDRIFVRDGPVTTSAGATAGMDLALALVEEDHGADVARAVARWTVMFLQRPGGQSQFSERLGIAADVAAPLRAVLDEVVADPAGDHRLGELARRASMSERHFRRRFADETGTTPARFVERVRVEAARDLLERTSTPIDEVASRCGFGSPETLRRACLRVIGVGPADYRGRFRTTARAPVEA